MCTVLFVHNKKPICFVEEDGRYLRIRPGCSIHAATPEDRENAAKSKRWVKFEGKPNTFDGTRPLSDLVDAMIMWFNDHGYYGQATAAQPELAAVPA